VERGLTLGEWAIIEYESSTGRKITTWNFPNFTDAEKFRRTRQEFYQSISLHKKRHLTPALPLISDAEMELFKKIIENPEWMSRIMHQLVR
jgi:hypothetical protein